MRDPLSFDLFTLSSGLRVFHQPRDLPWFAANMIVHAGSVDDPVGKEGLSHLLEHQVNSGTHGMPWTNFGEFQEWADARGFDFDHGSTGSHATKFGGRAWSRDAEAYFGFLEAYLRRPILDGMLDHDRRIIRAERIDRDPPLRRKRFEEAVRLALFGNRRQATATGLPCDDVLFSLTQEDVRLAHERHYACPNMTLVVVGGIDTTVLRTILEKTFVPDRPFRPRTPSRLPFDIDPPAQREIISKKDDGSPTTSVRVTHIWAMRPTGAESVLLRNCLARTLNDRVRELERLAYHVSVDVSRNCDSETFYVNTDVAPEKVDRARKAIEEVFSDVAAVLRHLPRQRKSIALAIARTDMNVAHVVTEASESIEGEGWLIPLHELAAQFIAVGDDSVIRLLKRLTPSRALVTIYET